MEGDTARAATVDAGRVARDAPGPAHLNRHRNPGLGPDAEHAQSPRIEGADILRPAVPHGQRPDSPRRLAQVPGRAELPGAVGTGVRRVRLGQNALCPRRRSQDDLEVSPVGVIVRREDDLDRLDSNVVSNRDGAFNRGTEHVEPRCIRNRQARRGAARGTDLRPEIRPRARSSNGRLRVDAAESERVADVEACAVCRPTAIVGAVLVGGDGQDLADVPPPQPRVGLQHESNDTRHNRRRRRGAAKERRVVLIRNRIGSAPRQPRARIAAGGSAQVGRHDAQRPAVRWRIDQDVRARFGVHGVRAGVRAGRHGNDEARIGVPVIVGVVGAVAVARGPDVDRAEAAAAACDAVCECGCNDCGHRAERVAAVGWAPAVAVDVHDLVAATERVRLVRQQLVLEEVEPDEAGGWRDSRDAQGVEPARGRDAPDARAVRVGTVHRCRVRGVIDVVVAHARHDVRREVLVLDLEPIVNDRDDLVR